MLSVAEASDNSLTGLTHEQKLREFSAVTTVVDEEFCRQALQASGWNVVNEFFTTAGRPKFSPQTDDSDWFNYFRNITRSSLGEDSVIGGYLALPLIDVGELFFGGVWAITNYIGSLLFPLSPEHNGYQDMNQQANTSLSISQHQQDYPHWFLRGRLKEAIAETKNQQPKLLLIILFQEGNPLSQRYINETLQNDAVASFLAHNLVCWACSSTSRDARGLLQQIPNSSTVFPLTTLFKTRDRQLQLLWKYDGFIDGDALIAFLMQALDRVQYAEEQVNASNLRAVQDMEYEELVARHQLEEKERLAATQSEEISPTSLEPDETSVICSKNPKQAAEEGLSVESEDKRAEFAALVPKEPNENDTRRIQFRFRLPDGTNAIRYFLPVNSVLDLKNFISSLELMSTSEEPVEEFELFTPFPKETYEDIGESIEVAFGHVKRVNLVVKEIF